ncbi:MAG: RHS repeat protein [Lachnospiraceae bacterium]|nr:RHS repeat protein [Lachnospiraceae bacterium]
MSTYDEKRGLLSKTEMPMGQETKYEYDALGEVTGTEISGIKQGNFICGVNINRDKCNI